jgi:hypothetical protein
MGALWYVDFSIVGESGDIHRFIESLNGNETFHEVEVRATSPGFACIHASHDCGGPDALDNLIGMFPELLFEGAYHNKMSFDDFGSYTIFSSAGGGILKKNMRDADLINEDDEEEFYRRIGQSKDYWDVDRPPSRSTGATALAEVPAHDREARPRDVRALVEQIKKRNARSVAGPTRR